MIDNLDRLSERQRLLVQAFSASSQGHPERAAELLEELITRYPDEERAYDLLALIQKYGLYRPEEALETFRRAVSALPASGYMRSSYGYALLRNGRYDEALAEFKTYGELNSRSANPLDCVGDYYLFTGRPDMALARFDEALRLEPTFDAHSGLAWAYGMLGRFEDAVTQASQCSRDRHFLSAFFLARAGRYQAAEVQLTEGEIAAANSGDVVTHNKLLLLRAMIELERSRSARVLSLTEQALESYRQMYGQPYAKVGAAIAHVLAGSAQVAAGDLDEARLHLESVQTLLPEPRYRGVDWLIGWLEAEILSAAGDLDAAEAACRTAQPKHKWGMQRGFLEGFVFFSNVPLRDMMAKVAATCGDLDAAIGLYRRLDPLHPDTVWVTTVEPRYVLEVARLLDQKGDHVAAREEYARFLELWKDADEGLPELDEARSRLAALGGPVQ